MSLIGNTNKEKSWNYFMAEDKIGNPYGTSGLLANIGKESGFNPMNMQNSFESKLGFTDETYVIAVDNNTYHNFQKDRCGFGLCQWTRSDRKTNMWIRSKETIKSIGDLEFNLDFIWWELTHGYGKVLDVLRNAKSVKEASDYVYYKYERPKVQNAERAKLRSDLGEEIYKEFMKSAEVNKVSYKFAIDAGHGSDTAGKRTPDGYREHWINVKSAYYCEQYLHKYGMETLRVAWDDLNYTDDENVDLSIRQKQIKNSKCDYSISFHANAYGDGKTYNSAQGVSTHIHSISSYRGDSNNLAKFVQAELIKGTKQKDRGIKLQNLAMCNCKVMNTKASILVEIGFMTNKYEAELMETEEFCKEQGEDVARGILNYLGITNNITDKSETYNQFQFIKDIQSSISVNVNGIVNDNMLSKLPTVSKTKNNRHAVIKPLQKYLNSLGFNCGVENGVADKNFDKATKAWAKANDCVADGEFTNGGKSWKVILGCNSSSSTSSNSSTTSSITSNTSSSNSFILNGLDYSLVFNPTYYANKHTDVVKVYGNTPSRLFEHFTEYGMVEGRQGSSDFNVEVYKSRYTDLQQAFRDDFPSYYRHYIEYGYKEGRSAT